jgi:protein O-mannosyl-transferase
MDVRKLRRSSSPATGRVQIKSGDLLLAASLVAATVLVYAQVGGFGFITVDDPAYVPANPHVREGITLRGVAWSLTAVHDCNWIPLTWLSLMLDTQIYGLRAGGYHLTNVFLHAASTVVLYMALVASTGSRARSAFVAALFALHPLHVESVAWVAERKDVLSTVFGLLSLLAYVRYATGAKWRSYAASVLFFICSLMSKQTLVTLPFVFLLLDYWPLGRLRPRNDAPPSSQTRSNSAGAFATRRIAVRLVGEKIPFFSASAAFSAIAVLTQSSGGAMTARFPIATRGLNAIVVYVAYLGKALYPQNLAFYYPHPGVRLGWVLVCFSAVLLVAITSVAIVWRRRYPFVFVGWFWYLGTLVPTIGLVQIGIQQMADRYTYFPLIGIYLAVVWIGPELVPAGMLRTRVLPVAVAASLLLLAATTFSQISYWHDSVTLLRHSMDCTPESSHAHELLGDALIGDGDVSGGVEELEKAIRMAAPYAPLHVTLGVGLERLGRSDDAARQYRAAIAIDERFAEAHSRLGALLIDRRQFEDAKRQLDRALEIDDSSAATHANFALLSLKMGRDAEAIAQAERALELNPELLMCHCYVALALRDQGHIDEAIRRFQQLVSLAPDDPIARDELTRMMAMKRGDSSTTIPRRLTARAGPNPDVPERRADH